MLIWYYTQMIVHISFTFQDTSIEYWSIEQMFNLP